jgi:hypothetical protein
VLLDRSSGTVDNDLRRVSRLLAPVADGQGVIETLNELARRYRGALPRDAVDAIRSHLVARERRIDSEAQAAHVLESATATLRAEGKRVKRWRLRAEGFRAIAPGLKESVRRARDAMLEAWRHPSPAQFHAWRRHVKNHWFHVRLLEARCGRRLMRDQRRLEALDGVLGEYHNLVLLRDVLLTDRSLSRPGFAECLRVIARYQRALRLHAQLLGARIYGEKPRRFVRRVRHLWRVTTPAAAPKARSR